MKNLFVLISILFIMGLSWAQELAYSSYDWDKNPVLHPSLPTDTGKYEIVLKSKHVVEFAFDASNNFYEYELKHKIIKLNSDEAIEKNNRIYIPMYEVDNILINKVRVITSNGKVKELDNSNIKEAKDEDGKGSYKYFAIEGIDKGSEIEYIQFIKSSPDYTGRIIFLQDETEQRNVSFELITPEIFIFHIHSINTSIQPKADSSFKDKNCFKIELEKTEGVKDEEFALYRPNLIQVHYKLKHNLNLGKKELFTYSELSSRVFDNIYNTTSSTGIKQLKKFIKSMKIDQNADEETKVRFVEDYIKSRFQRINASYPGIEEIENTLKNKFTTANGIARLFAKTFEELGINVQIVLTSDRSKVKFDDKNESYLYAAEYLFYFPKTGLYLAPTEPLTRLGFPPQYWTNNYGLFIKSVELSGVKTGIGQTKLIEPLSHEKTGELIIVKAKVNDDFDALDIDFTREMNGYYAQHYQPIYDFVNNEQRSELDKSLVKFLSEESEVTDTLIENIGLKYFGIKPLVAKGKIKIGSFIEKAGNKYLVKLGLLIGPQSELYEDKERKFPVENDHNRFYKRTITFEIPKGYKVANLKDLNFNVFMETKGNKTSAFESSYTLSENTLTVNVYEYYKQISYSLEEFPAYRDVINAAADFNKVTLILEPAN